MTETINYVREDIIEDERTAGMFGCVNANYQRAAEADSAESGADRPGSRRSRQRKQPSGSGSGRWYIPS